jgi:hypothetical protein
VGRTHSWYIKLWMSCMYSRLLLTRQKLLVAEQIGPQCMFHIKSCQQAVRGLHIKSSSNTPKLQTKLVTATYVVVTASPWLGRTNLRQTAPHRFEYSLTLAR